jgi:NDP-sugar pyrophosphorylase family protein
VTPTVAILAGGLATRMRPLTETVPKALLEVAGRPFAEVQLELLRDRGIQDVVMCVAYRGQAIEDALGDGGSLGIRIRYSYDGEELMGTAGALVGARHLLGDPFLVTYGDTYLDIDYPGVAEALTQSGRLALMAVFHNRGRWDTSNVLFEDGTIRSYDKVNPHPDAEHIDYGLGALTQAALDLVPAERPFDLATLYQQLLEKGELAAYEAPNRFYEIGSPDGLAELDQKLAGTPS